MLRQGSKRVKYFQHKKKNFLSPSDHVIFFLLYKILPIQQILFSVGRLLGFDISPESLCVSVFCCKGRNVRLNLATKCYNALSAFKPLAFGSVSLSISLSFRLSDVLGLFPNPLAFGSFSFALRVAIVLLNTQPQYKM